MCTFNGERFLSAQLESIAAQDRPPDELVVCDDVSSDDCCELVREFARRAAFPIRLVINDRNLGSTKNFEKAISLCKGAIVALADQDDVWYRHKLARIESAFSQSHEIVAAFSDADLIDDDSRQLGTRLWTAFSFDQREQACFLKGRPLNVLVKHPVATGATIAFPRQLFDIVAPIPGNWIHDRWISFLLAARGRVEIIPDALMQYRTHSGQQEGLPPVHPLGLLGQAKQRTANFHWGEIERFHQLYDRLAEQRREFQHAECAQKEIEKKIAHLTQRARLPHSRFARIPRVLREAFSGSYRRYSAGWRSVARDLMIR
jgi:glycosyltransferase involved in cell wall biosynthesis